MKLSKLFVFILLAGLVVVAYATSAAGQSLVSGQIDGKVTDPTGAVVPNVSINLVSTDTGFSAVTTTDAEGVFHFALLKPGSAPLKSR